MAEKFKKALRKSQGSMTRRGALNDDDNDQIQEVESDSDAVPPHQEQDQQDQVTSDTPSSSSVLQNKKGSLSNISEQVKKIMDTPLPTLTDAIMTPSKPEFHLP